MSRRGLISALFICTGASGLVFEVLWVKQLTLLVGSTTFAVSLTVSVFLGGLMLGAELAGRLTRRLERPLRAYAVAELLAGALASAVTLLLPQLPEALGGAALGVRAAAVAVLLLPPTVAMGATLPLLTRALVSDDARVGADVGTLYTLNTLGAVLGCGLGGFVAVSLLGVMRTSLLASAVNGVVGAVALWLSRVEVRAPPEPAGAPKDPRSWLDAFFFLSGFAAIAYEVFWFRVVAISFDASTYAFTVLLCTFLLGLVLGGTLYVRRLGRHPRPLETLASLQAGIALLGLIAFALIGVSPGLARFAQSLVAGPWGFVLGMAVHAALVILPATVLIGAVFPLVVRLGAERAADAGARVGRLYAVNTLGGICGSLAAGFLLIPTLGTQRGYALVCGLSMVLALWAQARDAEATRRARGQLFAAAALLAAGLFLPPSDHWSHAFVATPDAKVLALREGRDGTLAVLEYTRASVCESKRYRCDETCPEFAHRKLTFGAVSYASTVLPARRYMRFLAHSALLLRPQAAQVLGVCFGTGTTAAAFASHPQVMGLTLVDSNPDVFEQAALFREVNHDVLSDARVQRVVDDGRHFLLGTDRKFDVVSFEPPPPRALGVVNLYSRDFYALVKRRLNEGGVVTQWIPLDQQSARLDRALVKAMTDEFAHVSFYVPSRMHGVAVASDAPLPEDLAAWAAQLEVPSVRESLSDVGFTSPEEIQGTFFAADADLKKWVGDVPAVTDDRPSIEHFLFEWDRAFEVGDLLAVRPPSEAPAHRAEALRLTAVQAARNGDWDGARSLSAEADVLLPGNGYGDFLRTLEYRCLQPAR